MSGDCTESALNFLFSGVFVGEIFLLKLVLIADLSSSLKLSFFGDSVLELEDFLSSSHFFGDNEGLLNLFGINMVCFVFTCIELGDEIDLIGDDFGGVTTFFKSANEDLGDINS